MLVLSRRTNEQILLPELGVIIEVMRLKGNQVKLGISAPQAIRVLRGELAFERPVGISSNAACDKANSFAIPSK